MNTKTGVGRDAAEAALIAALDVLDDGAKARLAAQLEQLTADPVLNPDRGFCLAPP